MAYKKAALINLSMRFHSHDMKTSCLNLSLSVVYWGLSLQHTNFHIMSYKYCWFHCNLWPIWRKNRVDSKLWTDRMGELSKWHHLSWPSVGMEWGGRVRHKEEVGLGWDLGVRISVAVTIDEADSANRGQGRQPKPWRTLTSEQRWVTELISEK